MLLLLGALALALVQAKVPDNYEPVPGGSVCRTSPALDMIGSIPRFSLISKGAVKSDLGSYNLFDCSGTGDERTCSFAMPSLTDPAGMLLNGEPGSLIDYGEGVLAYAILNIVLVILIPLCAAIFILFRYCCCCCRADRCTCLRCGAAWPTKRTCCCGFRALPTGEFGYTGMERGCTYLFLVSFLVFLVAMILMGEVQGNKGLSSAMQALVSKDKGVGTSIVTILDNALAPISTLLIALSGNAVAPLLLDINATLGAAVDLREVSTGMKCVNRSLSSLPDINVALGFLGTLDTALNNIKTSVGDIETGINGLLTVKTTVTNSANDLKTELTNLGTGFTTVGASLGIAGGLADAMDSFKTTLVDPSTGLLPLAKADLVLISQHYPSSSDFDSAGGNAANPSDFSGSANMNRLIGDQMEGVPAEIGALVAKLNALLAELNQLPDFSVTAQRLDDINSQIYYVLYTNPLLDKLGASLTDVGNGLAALPGSSQIDPYITSILNAADSVDVTPLLTAVASIDSNIQSLPDFNILLDEIAKVKLLRDIVPCVGLLTKQIGGINDTIAQLPDAINDLTSMLDSANATIETALAQVDSTDAQVRAANDTVHSVDVTAYTADITAVQTNVQSQKNALDVTALRASLTDLDNKKAVSFSAVLNSLNTLAATLAASEIDNTTIAALRTFETYKADMIAQLTTEAGYYAQYAQGYCANSGSFALCTSDADCPSPSAGQCTSIALKRCSGTYQNTACHADSDCPVASNAVCLVDNTRAGTLKGTLNGAASQTPTGVSAAVTNIDNALADANIDIASEKQKIMDAQTAIAAIDVTVYNGVLDSLTSGMDSFDTTATLATLTDIRNSIDAVPFADFTTQLNDVSGTVSNLDGVKSTLADAIGTVDVLAELFYDDLGDLTSRLSSASLTYIRIHQGLGSVITAITGVVDDMVSLLHNGQSLLPIPDLQVTSMVANYTPYLDRATATGQYADLKDFGPAYFLASVAAPDMVVDGNVMDSRTVLRDANSQTYAGSDLCVTDKCLSATVALANTEQIGAAGVALDVSAVPDAPLSRENIFTILWVFPIIVLLFGAWALIAPCCCKSPGWQKVPVAWMTGCIICQLPCIFLLTGVFFPLMLILGDGCATGPNIGYNYVLSYDTGVCPMIQGSGSLTSCSVSQSVAAVDLTVNATLDVAALYRGIVGKCPPVDPFAPAFDQLSGQARTLLVDLATKQLNSGSLNDMVKLRQGVKDIVIRAANVTGASMATFIDSLGDGVVNCGSVNSVVAEVKDALCCGFVTPMWWYVSAWYLIAWAMLCCGIPVGCLGRKRLPKAPWGPALELEQAGGGPLILEDPKHGKNGAPAAPLAAADGSVLKNVNTKRGGAKYEAADVDGVDFGSGRPSVEPHGKKAVISSKAGVHTGASTQVAVNIGGSNPMYAPGAAPVTVALPAQVVVAPKPGLARAAIAPTAHKTAV